MGRDVMDVEPGFTQFYETPWSYGGIGSDFSVLQDFAKNYEEDIMKAIAGEYTTGEGVVLPSYDGNFGTSNLRTQFMLDALEQMSFNQEDARMMKMIAKPKVYSNTVEWTAQKQYGGAGSGFVGETGHDGAYNITGSDDVFARLLRQIKFMGTTRELGLISTLVRNVKNPESVAENSATHELIGKCDQAIYFGDSRMDSAYFDGITRQILDWCLPTTFNGYGFGTDDQDLMFDLNGDYMDADRLTEIARVCREKYGSPGLLMMSSQGYGDTQRTLFPFMRTELGSTGNFGGDKDTFKSIYGNIKLDYDLLLRPNRPLVPDGTGISGKALTTSQTGALEPAASLLTASGSSVDIDFATNEAGRGIKAYSPGLGDWFNPVDTYGNDIVAAPAVPSGIGNQTNQLVGGTAYYYGVSVVYHGRESKVYIYGSGTDGTAGTQTPVAVTPTSAQIVGIAINNANITGISSTNYRNVRFRVYRTTVSPTTAALARNMEFVMEIGCMGATGVSIGFDNGMYKPGTDNAFLMTKKRNGVDGFFLAQLLPIIKRALPNKALSDPFAYLMFVAPILRTPRHHVWVRNIGHAPL